MNRNFSIHCSRLLEVQKGHLSQAGEICSINHCVLVEVSRSIFFLLVSSPHVLSPPPLLLHPTTLHYDTQPPPNLHLVSVSHFLQKTHRRCNSFKFPAQPLLPLSLSLCVCLFLFSSLYSSFLSSLFHLLILLCLFISPLVATVIESLNYLYEFKIQMKQQGRFFYYCGISPCLVAPNRRCSLSFPCQRLP